MKRLLIAALVLALGASFLVVPAVSADSDDVLWGVTGINFGTDNEYSEVFKVDTSTGVVTMVNDDPSNPLYSDIAVTPDGKVYAVGRTSTNHNFTDFFRLTSTTGEVMVIEPDAFTDAGFYHVNGLSAESNTSLLAIEGGGVCTGWGSPTGPRLLRINLDGAGDLASITNLGAIAGCPQYGCCSDGDLDKDPDTGKWYAGFYGDAGSDMMELNLADPGSSTYKSQSDIKWQGGLAFSSDGTAYAGCWATEILYTVNIAGGGSAVAHDLSSDLSGNIFGLSKDKEPEEQPPVGGSSLPTDKAALMLPWVLGAGALLMLAGAFFVWNRKRDRAQV